MGCVRGLGHEIQTRGFETWSSQTSDLKIYTYRFLARLPGAVTESVEDWHRLLEVVGSNPGRVKPMT